MRSQDRDGRPSCDCRRFHPSRGWESRFLRCFSRGWVQSSHEDHEHRGYAVAACPVDSGPDCPAQLKGPFESSGLPVGCKSACFANLDGNQALNLRNYCSSHCSGRFNTHKLVRRVVSRFTATLRTIAGIAMRTPTTRGAGRLCGLVTAACWLTIRSLSVLAVGTLALQVISQVFPS